MSGFFPIVTALVLSITGFLACHTSPEEKPAGDSTTAIVPAPDPHELEYRDQQKIEKVIYGCCEYFDNGDLHCPTAGL